MNGYYTIHASVGKTDVDGWSSTRQLPTFYLHSNVQGIMSEASACRIARGMIVDILNMGGDDSVVVHVYAAHIGE